MLKKQKTKKTFLLSNNITDNYNYVYTDKYKLTFPLQK